MNEINYTILFASIIAGATPVVFAALGETISEKSGIINLSLDGSIMLSAMTAFVVSYNTGSVVLGFITAALIGGFIALIVAVFSIYMNLSQVAVGFVLTLTARDLAYFLGNSYSRLHGPQITPDPLPFLSEIPFIGSVFFNHNFVIYTCMASIFLVWFYIERTPMGHKLKSVGEYPNAAFSRGINPKKIRLLYTVIGGLFVGIAGASFSLCIKAGWGRPQGCEGTGWIALALVIFGGWNPIKVAIGAYLFSFLQVMGIYFQHWLPSVPSQVFQVAPFPLMIFSLLLVNISQQESILLWSKNKKFIGSFLRKIKNNAPGYLGKNFTV